MSNIFEFPIKWEKGKGLDPTSCQSHQDYLTQMCGSVSQSLEQQISLAADMVSRQTCHPTYQEVLVHSIHCRTIYKSYKVYAIQPQINETPCKQRNNLSTSKVPMFIFLQTRTSQGEDTLAIKTNGLVPMCPLLLWLVSWNTYCGCLRQPMIITSYFNRIVPTYQNRFSPT